MTSKITAALAIAAMLVAGGASAAEKKTTAKKGTKSKTAAKKTTKAAAKPAGPDYAKLLDPASLIEKAPDVFKAKFDTSKGAFVIEVHREWSPLGADRFYNLVKNGFYDNVRFFRVVSGFMAQFGLNGDPKVSAAWKPARISDDPVVQSNTRGMVSFAIAGPNTRTTQLFINYVDNVRLDSMGFSPFGKVIEGMEVVDMLYPGYGEGAPRGAGPAQDRITSEGNEYLNAGFPQLDYVKTARIQP
jgi:peptidyl-prolyl cis-trans isomerase A (cyclophilin A)